MKITALLSSPSPDGGAPVASSLIELLKSRCLTSDLPGFSLQGLVVSEVLSHLTDNKDARILIQAWTTGSEDGTCVLDYLLPGEARGDGVEVDAWVIREHIFKQPVERQSIGASPNGVKLAGTAYRRDDFAVEAFFDYWRNVHAKISGSVPGIGGYVVSEVRGQLSGDLAPDALLELWWPDQATFEASGSTPEQVAAWEDVPRYAKTTGTFWLMRESVLIPPPPTGPGSLEVGDA